MLVLVHVDTFDKFGSIVEKLWHIVTFGYVWLFLVSDAQRRKELRCAASGDVGDSDITVKDFIENCRQFEDDLCKKYGVQKEQLLYTPNIENIVPTYKIIWVYMNIYDMMWCYMIWWYICTYTYSIIEFNMLLYIFDSPWLGPLASRARVGAQLLGVASVDTAGCHGSFPAEASMASPKQIWKKPSRPSWCVCASSWPD